MKNLAIIILFTAIAFTAKAQTISKKSLANQEVKKQVVDIACGECQFKIKGKSCDLAIRIDGISYFVDGKNIDDFGDAHGEHGFCNAVSKAEVSGKIINGRFKAKNIKLLSK
ncbi:DUF6370 family protein [Pedobacter sp. Leaf250]|uniref:DUF6370 family protein n=1 Tax=Pedobacter sp. Leaf250 TaxID=2876559 RepID=UPI001E37CB29|nr:DUF6370 family protein [Pedobacter sp. Leaf250]